MSRSRLRLLLLSLGLVIAASGCQHQPAFFFAPVEGTITKGGRPLPDVQVVFLGDRDAGTVGPRASGITDQDGRYRLQGDLLRGESVPQDGVVVGKHRVSLVDLQAKSETPVGELRVPPRYESITETPLRAEVHPGPQTLDLDIP